MTSQEMAETVDTYINGNVSDFRQAIRDMNTDEIVDFVRWINGLDACYPDSTIITILSSALIGCKEGR